MPTENHSLPHCWFLAGPTAVGKTATALELAELLGAEIVSLDSMAIYRGMDIGTAKPSIPERSRIAHHLIDVADPHEEFSVSEYVDQASAAVETILGRDRVPLFVGGTGLYLRSMLRGVFAGPSADWDLRRELQQQADERGNLWLHNELRSVDPVSAQRLHVNDVRRIIRALEVWRITGQPLSSLHNQQPLPPEQRAAAVFWIDPPRDWLHDRINRRVDLMLEHGLLLETQRLLCAAPPPGRTARQALGYRELISHLEGAVPLAEAVEKIKTATRQFAKRQHTWFRNLEECTSISITGEESAAELAGQLAALGSR